MKPVPLLAFLIALTVPAQAQQSVDALHYAARIQFDLAAQQLDAVASVHLRNTGAAALPVLRLHLRDLAVTDVTGSRAVQGYAADTGTLAVTFAEPLPAGDTTTLTVRYHGKATSEAGSQSWGGCFWGDPAFAMGVGFFAPYVSMTRHWLPSNDVPDDKATFDLTYVVPTGYAAAGSGVLTGPTPVSDGVEYRWIETHPTATYLVTYAISRYGVARDTIAGIPCEYYVPQNSVAKAKNYFATVRGMVAAYEKAYGRYPFDKIGYCLTPIGSMEHQTMISYASSLFWQTTAGGIAAHELAHQWWGDCVTPKDFREAWLSEGFATYSEAVYAEHLSGKGNYYQTVRNYHQEYFSTEANEGTFALYDFPRTAPSSNYPGTIYSKGMSVLAMLRHVTGDSAFYRGLRAYRAAHEYGNATTQDFRAAMETASGLTLDWFFDEWVYKPGYPRYRVYYPFPPSADTLWLSIRQRTDDTLKYPLYTMPLDVWIILRGGDTVRTAIQTHAVPAETFTFAGIRRDSVRSVLIDPLDVVLKKIDWIEVGVEDPQPSPLQGYLLESGYPNPCSLSAHGRAVIPFELRRQDQVRIEVLDILGRSVGTLADGPFDAGRHLLPFQPDGLTPGLYTVRMLVPAGVSATKLLLTK
jgi:aminopeptidase N